MTDIQQVQQYYDMNTKRFLTFGHGGSAHAIHRAVWGPGVSTRLEAIHYVHDLLTGIVHQIEDENVLDLGCGVGGSMLYLAKRINATFYGITLSKTQKTLGQKVLRQHKVQNRCHIVKGDFLNKSTYHSMDEQFDLCYAIESFVHATSALRFFQRISSVTRPSARLILCDDFLQRNPITSVEQALLNDYTDGWHIRTLLSINKTIRIADKFGFKPTTHFNLTPYLELNRLRDRLIRKILKLFHGLELPHPGFKNLKGGYALQQAIQKGLIGYHFLVFERI